MLNAIRPTLGGVLVATALAVAAGCPSSPSGPRPSPGDTAVKPAAPQVSIGSATMERDGTLVFMLRAEGPGGIRGDAQFRYPPNHRQYQEMLQHVGGLNPGESKPVPPFPEKR